MGIFNRAPKVEKSNNQAELANMVLGTISDGVMIVGQDGLIKLANPAATTMIGYGNANSVIGLEYLSVIKLEDGQGAPVPDEQNPLAIAMRSGKPVTTRKYILVSAQSGKRTPVSLSLLFTKNYHSDRIITFRDIAKELEEESAQSEFISTASHEMRTPVASIEGYLGLALNPQTATIDDRARKFLEEAHTASAHLGRLFQDLLDVTKLDDNHVRIQMVPTEIRTLVKSIADSHIEEILKKHIKYSFGTVDAMKDKKQIEQTVYGSVDHDFMREILDNLIENAIKYTDENGEIWVNVRGDGDRILINVTDSGIGIAPDDIDHVFQKFYRSDNSQTRTIGGTGLGLYLVKLRTEAMGGKVWVESSFGDGSTFYVSLPRITAEEYEKRRIAMVNQQVRDAFNSPALAKQQAAAQSTPVSPAPQPQPVQAPAQPEQPQPTPQPSAINQPEQTPPTPNTQNNLENNNQV